MDIMNTKLQIFKKEDYNALASYENLDGWAIYDYNDLDGGEATEPAFYLRATHKKKDIGIVLSKTALQEMLSEVRALDDDEEKQSVAYGNGTSTGTTTGTSTGTSTGTDTFRAASLTLPPIVRQSECSNPDCGCQ